MPILPSLCMPFLALKHYLPSTSVLQLVFLSLMHALAGSKACSVLG